MNISACLAHVSYMEAAEGEYERATELSSEAVRLAERSGNRRAIALALNQRVLASNGYDGAEGGAARAMAVLRDTGDLLQMGVVCSARALADEPHRAVR